MITPFPQQTPPLEGHLLHYIWSQWFTGLRAAVNGTPGNSVPVAFAALPQPVTGMVFMVTDSTVNGWGDVVTGGGAFTVAALYNGTTWTVIGK
jgi:hypothetical protein